MNASHKDLIDKQQLAYWQKFKRYAETFYSFGDDFYKVIGYETEKQRLIDSGFTNNQAEIEAASRIRNTYPTYSYVPKNFRRLRRFPNKIRKTFGFH